MPEISPTEALGAQAKKIFFGVARAPKEWSEFQGKQFLKLYDKFYFDKQSPEQKKVLRKVRPIIEKRAKALGWVATGVEVAAVAGAAVWGFQRLKKGNISIPTHAPMTEAPMTSSASTFRRVSVPQDHPRVDSYETLRQGRERYQWTKHTLLPDDAVDRLRNREADIQALMATMKKDHNLLDDDILSAFARAWIGFEHSADMTDEQLNQARFLGDFLQFGGSKFEELIAKLKMNLPDQHMYAFQREYDPKQALRIAQQIFREYHQREKWWQKDRPDMEQTFGLWGKLQFAALDFLLKNRGTNGVHDDLRMGMLRDAWNEHGWVLEQPRD